MTVKLISEEQKYQFLSKRIREEMASAYKNHSLSEEEMMAFLYILQKVSSYWELRLMVAVFREKFVFLQDVDSAVREIQKGDLEIFLQKKLPDLLKTEPDKVVEMTKYAAQPGVTLVELMNKYKGL